MVAEPNLPFNPFFPPVSNPTCSILYLLFHTILLICHVHYFLLTRGTYLIILFSSQNMEIGQFLSRKNRNMNYIPHFMTDLSPA